MLHTLGSAETEIYESYLSKTGTKKKKRASRSVLSKEEIDSIRLSSFKPVHSCDKEARDEKANQKQRAKRDKKLEEARGKPAGWKNTEISSAIASIEEEEEW
jgi:nitrate/TMAO reductase-like tetraheme cytochrome c subunit